MINQIVAQTFMPKFAAPAPSESVLSLITATAVLTLSFILVYVIDYLQIV